MLDLAKRYWLAIAIVGAIFVFRAGESSASKADPDMENYAKGTICWCLSEHVGGPVIPGPGPSGGECDNCGGRGKVGDGTIMKTCPVCNGTGRHPSPSPDDGDAGQISFPAPGEGLRANRPLPPDGDERFTPIDADDETEVDADETANAPAVQFQSTQFGDCADGSCGTSSGGRGRVGFFRRVFGRR